MNAAPFLEPYGYTLTPEGNIVTPGGRVTSVVLKWERTRFRARMASRLLLWSGSDPGDFLKRYWYAERLPVACPRGCWFDALSHTRRYWKQTDDGRTVHCECEHCNGGTR